MSGSYNPKSMPGPVYALSEEFAGAIAQSAAAAGVPVRLVRVGLDGTLLDVAGPLEAVQPGAHVSVPVLRRLLREQPSIRWVSVTSAGADAFLVPELTGREAVVTRIRHIHNVPVAEFAMALLLAAAKRLPDIVQAQDRREWLNLQLPQVAGTTLVIVGYGEIGRALAQRARPFVMGSIGV